MVLYDAYGQPVKPQELTREIAAPSITGIRRVWDETVANGMTPYRLARILRSAAGGDADDYLTLAEEMEEKDLHYACEMGKRKLAVSRLDISVESFSDSSRDIELADAVRGLARRFGIRGLIKDLLDALGKGYSVVEIMWNRTQPQWTPERYKWRDPRFFMFDQATRHEIRLRDEANMVEGIALAPYKFIRHIHKMKSGIPLRGGIARLAAWAWMFKNYTVKDWMAFGETFGMPLRIGKYGSGAMPEDINILKMAVANLGSDAAAVIPDSMIIDLVETAKATGGESFYQRMADWFDAQVSRGILGQTATTQGTPGKLGNEEAQKEVREDIRDDDAEQIEETINRDLVKPFIDLNFGLQENYPLIQVRATKQENIATLSEALSKLVPLGLRVEQSVVRDRMGIPDPNPNAKPEDLLGQFSTSVVPSKKPDIATNHETACPHCRALNSETAAQPDQIDQVAQKALDQDDGSYIAAQIYHVIAGARTIEVAATQLANYRPDLIDIKPVANALANGQLLANLIGRDEIMTDLALNAEAQPISLPFDEAIQFFRQKLNIKSDVWSALYAEEHDHAFTVAGVMRDDMLEDFRTAIDQAIAEGTTYQAFLADFDTIVAKYGWSYNGSRGWRTRTIYENNIRPAYNAGRYSQMTDPDVLRYRPNWMYQHGDSIHPRPMHLGWNGTVLPADDPWWDTHFTPNGWGCKCRIIALSNRDLTRLGKTVGTAPNDGSFEWVNPSTGEVRDIPRGIDPGWDYNPGKQWLNPATGTLENR